MQPMQRTFNVDALASSRRYRYAIITPSERNKFTNQKAGQSPTCSPPGTRKRDCAFLTYLRTGYASLL